MFIEEIEDETDLRKYFKDGVAVIKFYSQECGYCEKFAPMYQKIAEESKDDNVKFYVLNVSHIQQYQFQYHLYLMYRVYVHFLIHR